MDLGIKGKTAIVTGASSGLGKAIAAGFAAEGAKLVICARRAELLQENAGELESSYGATVRVVPGDLRKREDVNRLVEAARELGGPDILVINTGRPPVPLRHILDEREEERWRSAYETQLWAAALLVQEVVPVLVERRWGRVIGVTSASVKQPMPHHGLSTIFRAGVTGMLKHLANEVGASGVTVNSVCPGSIATASMANYDMEARVRGLPLHRLGEPSELASAVLYFASQQAGFITGASLQVDGGGVGSLC